MFIIRTIEMPMTSPDGGDGGSSAMHVTPDLTKVVELRSYVDSCTSDKAALLSMHREAVSFLQFYNWCDEIIETYVGLFSPGIIGVFLFKILPSRDDVDDWVWVVVGDLPPAYITCDDAPNPATALDGYIGAMTDWVGAAERGESVDELIPVNVPATKENAESLRKRLQFLDDRILSAYSDDLKY